MSKNKISMDKQYSTRDGRKVRRVLCVDRNSEKYPVVVELEDGTISALTEEGYIAKRDSEPDIIEITEPKLREWTYDEVPVGAIIKEKGRKRKTQIVSVNDDLTFQVNVGCCNIPYERLLLEYEVYLNGEWQPCGVVE